jgi:hypothetical protein
VAEKLREFSERQARVANIVAGVSAMSIAVAAASLEFHLAPRAVLFPPVAVVVYVAVAVIAYFGIRSALTRQYVRVLWLRRFRAESGFAYRVSNVIDRLSRSGISAVTLQDRDVRSSREQRRGRFAKRFWTIFILLTAISLALAAFIAAVLANDVTTNEAPIAQPIGMTLWNGALRMLQVFATFQSVLILLVLVVSLCLTWLSNFFGSWRNDYENLREKLDTSRARNRGSIILRVQMKDWQNAVTTCIRATDLVILDVSDLSDAMIWEIDEVTRLIGAQRVVLLKKSKTKGAAPDDWKPHLAKLPPLESAVEYPAVQTSTGMGTAAFASNLRKAIFAAYEKSGEDKEIAVIRNERRERINAEFEMGIRLFGGLVAIALLAVGAVFALTVARP